MFCSLITVSPAKTPYQSNYTCFFLPGNTGFLSLLPPMPMLYIYSLWFVFCPLTPQFSPLCLAGCQTRRSSSGASGRTSLPPTAQGEPTSTVPGTERRRWGCRVPRLPWFGAPRLVRRWRRGTLSSAWFDRLLHREREKGNGLWLYEEKASEKLVVLRGFLPAFLSSGKVRCCRWKTCGSFHDWLNPDSSTSSDGSDSLSEMVNCAAIEASGGGGES